MATRRGDGDLRLGARGQACARRLGVSTAGLTLPEIAPWSTQDHTPRLWGGRRRVYLWSPSPCVHPSQPRPCQVTLSPW